MTDPFDAYKHFCHRAGFGLHLGGLEDVSTALEPLIEACLEEGTKPLIDPGPRHTPDPDPVPSEPSMFFSEADHKQESTMTDSTVTARLTKLRHDWINIMTTEPCFMREKMALFWHSHFACRCTDDIRAQQYLDTLRQHALGNFGTLLHAVAKTPAMIHFLNNLQSRKDHPNENFARELMELFTLGIGHFTEDDVIAAARAFTGWSSDRWGNFLFRPEQHDNGLKSFLGHIGNLTGEDVIEIILDNEATPVFLATNLYRFFVNDKIDQEQVKKIAHIIKMHKYEIAPVMHFIFTSDFFYQEENRGIKVKSPIELIVQLGKVLNMKFKSAFDVSFLQRAMGQVLLDPPSVNGWPGGRAWINNSTIMIRLNLAHFLLRGIRFDHAVSTPLEAMAPSRIVGLIDVTSDISGWADYFSGTPYKNLEEEIKRVFLSPLQSPQLHAKPRGDSKEYTEDLMIKTLSLPEFQMC